MSTVLVIGASRGIGREFVRQYAQDGERVIASYRKAEDGAELRSLGAHTVALDVTDAASLALLPLHLGDERIDVMILNAGVFGPNSSGIEPVSMAQFDHVMHTNVWAPMQLIAMLAPRLKAAPAKLVLVSSRMGSTALMNSAQGWLYRASKAAANSVLRAASLELGPHGAVCMAFHPGWVKTEMGGPGAHIEVTESVRGMRRVIAAANASHNGKFLNYTGAQFDW